MGCCMFAPHSAALTIVLLGVLTVSWFGNEAAQAAPAVAHWQKGSKLGPGRSDAFSLSPGTEVRLSESAVIEVRPKVTLPPGIEGVAPQAFAAQLNSGRLEVTVDPGRRPADGVMLFGPRKTSIFVRGGRVTVAAQASGVAVGVNDGKDVSVGIGTTWKTVSPGRMMVVAASGVAESPLPPPPSRIVAKRLILAVDGASEPLSATWNAVPGAKRYAVELTGAETKVLRRFDVTEPAFTVSELGPGKYAIRVSTEESYGIRGIASEPVFVHVMGIRLPSGAFLSNGKVYLEPNRPMEVLNGTGIEMAYDESSAYSAVEPYVGLRGSRATRLNLRVAGEQEPTRIELLPQTFSATIALGPAKARWPRDKVSVRVELPGELADFPQIQVAPQVTVNNKPLELQWRRTGAVLEATIPRPPHYPGPWIIRAVVTDQHGRAWGRDFLEVASMVGADDQEPPREIRVRTEP